MTKLSLLEQMRIQREQREAPALTEIKDYSRRLSWDLHKANDALQAVTKITANRLGKATLQRAVDELGSAVVHNIQRAIINALGKQDREIVAIASANDLRFMRQDTLERNILDEMLSKIGDGMDMSVSLGPHLKEEVAYQIRVEIPRTTITRTLSERQMEMAR